ncbi:CLUMA_CG007108, isoform A [Clunio marinus]|uniref:CLUMA_CG007108, isoform A n=1 Tax=Clunio marinus TaxID=568069 RepID=A0A1J1HZN9_9DIPT|nr:CLUMA_CG007108, isoform A [Clunio marinus]
MNSNDELSAFTYINSIQLVQIENEKICRDRGTLVSRIDLSGLCVSSNTTTKSIATMRQHTEQRTPSSRIRNSNALIIDSQGNSIPLSPVSSNTSSGSDNVEQHKPVPMTPSVNKNRPT